MWTRLGGPVAIRVATRLRGDCLGECVVDAYPRLDRGSSSTTFWLAHEDVRQPQNIPGRRGRLPGTESLRISVQGNGSGFEGILGDIVPDLVSDFLPAHKPIRRFHQLADIQLGDVGVDVEKLRPRFHADVADG
jgi:hypothetical protein